MKTQGYVVHSAGAQLEPFEFDRRQLRPRDVALESTTLEFATPIYTKHAKSGIQQFFLWCLVMKWWAR